MHLDRRAFLTLAASPAIAARTSNLVATTDRPRILAAAAKFVSQAPLTITAFPAPGSAGKLHDFYSQADYSWPNPNDPNGPYIDRDGHSNPDNFDDHRKVMIALSIQVPALTAAWLLTSNASYAHKAADHLRAWFVTPETRMNPNLQFAQGVKGRSTGRSYGIIDTLHLVEVARAAGFLAPRVLNRADRLGVNEWFTSYLDWLCNSDRGKTERDATNNHAYCWALQVAEFARLVNNQPLREEMHRRYRDVLLAQMAPDGSFPRELARTKPYGYSIFNFDALAGLCQSLKDLKPDPAGLCKAAAFIYPYLQDKSTWKWPKDVEHFDSWPVRSPGLLFAGLACHEQKYLDLWKSLDPDPTDKEIIRNYPIRQPLLWVCCHPL